MGGGESPRRAATTDPVTATTDNTTTATRVEAAASSRVGYTTQGAAATAGTMGGKICLLTRWWERLTPAQLQTSLCNCQKWD